MTNITDNRTRIFHKALELFIMYGIKSVSMDDIAKPLGISKKTIYSHFKDKNGLVLEIVKAILDKTHQACDTDRQLAANAIQESFIAINQTTDLISSMNPLMVYELKKYYPVAYKGFLDFKNKFLYTVLKENLIRGINEGLFRADLNVEVVVSFRLETVLEAFSPEIYKNAHTSVGEIHEELFYLFLYGIATPKGNQLINKYKQQRLNNSVNEK